MYIPRKSMHVYNIIQGGSESYFLGYNLETKTTMSLFLQSLKQVVVMAEWLRRWTRNPLGSARAGSNPADYDHTSFLFLFLIPKTQFFFLLFWLPPPPYPFNHPNLKVPIYISWETAPALWTRASCERWGPSAEQEHWSFSSEESAQSEKIRWDKRLLSLHSNSP